MELTADIFRILKQNGIQLIRNSRDDGYQVTVASWVQVRPMSIVFDFEKPDYCDQFTLRDDRLGSFESEEELLGYLGTKIRDEYQLVCLAQLMGVKLSCQDLNHPEKHTVYVIEAGLGYESHSIDGTQKFLNYLQIVLENSGDDLMRSLNDYIQRGWGDLRIRNSPLGTFIQSKIDALPAIGAGGLFAERARLNLMTQYSNAGVRLYFEAERSSAEVRVYYQFQIDTHRGDAHVVLDPDSVHFVALQRPGAKTKPASEQLFLELCRSKSIDDYRRMLSDHFEPLLAAVRRTLYKGYQIDVDAFLATDYHSTETPFTIPVWISQKHINEYGSNQLISWRFTLPRLDDYFADHPIPFDGYAALCAEQLNVHTPANLS